MKEQHKHKNAFEHYYLKLNEGMTAGESVLSVANTFGVNRRTVRRWRKNFDWENKTAIRDINIQDSLEEKINTTIVDNKAKYLGIIHFSLNKYVEEVNNKTREPIPIENSRDLVRLIRTSLLIQNQPTDIHEQKGSMKHEYSGKIEAETVFTRVDKLLQYIEVSNDRDDDQQLPK
jgi:transposase-like protein